MKATFRQVSTGDDPEVVDSARYILRQIEKYEARAEPNRGERA